MGFAAAALAAEPLLDGLPGADRADVVRGDAEWTITVGARSVTVPAPRTPEEEARLRVLVEGLLSELPLDAGFAESADKALALLEPPAPPPPPAPALDDPRLAWRVYVGPELVDRAGTAAGPGAALGAEVGSRAGIGARVAYRPERGTRWGDSTRLREVVAELDAWTDLGPLALRGGVAGALRTWSQRGEAAPVAQHVAPVGVGEVGVPTGAGGWGVEVVAGAEVDLAVTRVAVAGSSVPAEPLLWPIAARFELRLGPR